MTKITVQTLYIKVSLPEDASNAKQAKEGAMHREPEKTYTII